MQPILVAHFAQILMPLSSFNWNIHWAELNCDRLFDNNRCRCYYSLVETQLPRSHPELSKHFYPLLHVSITFSRETISKYTRQLVIIVQYICCHWSTNCYYDIQRFALAPTLMVMDGPEQNLDLITCACSLCRIKWE